MFNMQKIGKKISSLRKEHNMTQMELADKLGISFQAVSNWERGGSMPDISKLPELAEIFNISLDELLGEKAMVVEAAMNDRIVECIENDTISDEDISDVLPLLKPQQVNNIVEMVMPLVPLAKELQNDAGGDNAPESNLSKIENFLPFMDEEDVKEFAMMAMEKGEKIDNYLPFMDEDDVKELAMTALEKGEKIDNYLPFIDEDDVKELAMSALEKGEKIDNYLPFMDEEGVKELALYVLRNNK